VVGPRHRRDRRSSIWHEEPSVGFTEGSRASPSSHDNQKRGGEGAGNAQMPQHASSITMRLYRSLQSTGWLVVTPSISASSESASFERLMKNRSI